MRTGPITDERELEKPPEYRPRRVTLISNPDEIADREIFPALLNPTTLRESIGVEWTKLGVIGLDHEVPHYARTKSIELPLTFYFSQYFAGTEPRSLEEGLAILTSAQTSKIRGLSMDFANFMRSLCFPSQVSLRPPFLKVIWPNVLTLTGVVTSLSFEYKKFDRTLAPLIYQADITLLETRVTRRWAEQVRMFGLRSDPDRKKKVQP